jgi:hypothetical protein
MRLPQKQRQRELPFVVEFSGPQLPTSVQESCRQLLAELLVHVLSSETNEREENEREDSTGAS